METTGEELRNGTLFAKGKVKQDRMTYMTNGTLTGNDIHGNYPRFHSPTRNPIQIADSSQPVAVWNSAKPKCVNWNMVAALSAVAVVSAAGWAGLAYLISHLLG